ncbi:hypothetical protein CAJAP_01864 [Camponotus japonicus]
MDNKLQNFGRRGTSRSRGKKRGQFAKKSVVIGRDNNAIAVSKRKAMDREKKELKLCTSESQPADQNRRIVDLSTFESDMFCHECQIPLSILDRTEETKFGLASVFTVPCAKCHTPYRVRTDKRMSTSNGFALNSVVALGFFNE